MAPRSNFYEGIGEPLTFCFLIVDGLSMMSLSSAIEPLRSANRLLGRQAFAWRLCSLDGRPVTASNDIVLQAQPIDEALVGAHAIILCGGVKMVPDGEKFHHSALRAAERRGIAVGALSTGSHLLARAGLLDGYRCTIHWENNAAFEESFPHLTITGKIYEIDRNRLTCSGGTAAVDMMLRIMSDRHGADLARGVANQFHHERIRDAGEDQQGGRLQQVATLPSQLQAVIQRMQNSLETPESIDSLADFVQLSSRQLERQFKHHLGTTPARYYLSLRIERGRELLMYTNQTIVDVAVAVGFMSTSHFSKWFRKMHGTRPTELRESVRRERLKAQSDQS